MVQQVGIQYKEESLRSLWNLTCSYSLEVRGTVILDPGTEAFISLKDTYCSNLKGPLRESNLGNWWDVTC